MNSEPSGNLCQVNHSTRTGIIHKRTDEDIIHERLFFSCVICDGPLVPSSTCVVCKKTMQRRCARCSILRDFGMHELCMCLFSLSAEIHQLDNKGMEVNL